MQLSLRSMYKRIAHLKEHGYPISEDDVEELFVIRSRDKMDEKICIMENRYKLSKAN